MDSDSLEIFGITKPTDEKYANYKKIYDLCESSNVNLPDEVEEYFENDYPEEKLKQKLNVVKNEDVEMITRWELDVQDIPKGVEKIVIELNWD
jgi:hypothetical protein